MAGSLAPPADGPATAPGRPNSPASSGPRWISIHRPWLAAVLAAGLMARVILVPLGHGSDFVVWDLASKASLSGVDVYAHHPAYPGGPFAYFPLFLYLELPMQWLAVHTGISFTVLGKLPILVADVVAAATLAAEMRRRGHGDRGQALAAGLFFLNPLVLYNSAFYGRFDSVCVALLLLAAGASRGRVPVPWHAAAVYALSIAAKTFPVFILPWFLRRDRTTAARVAIACSVVLLGLSAPYLLSSPRAFLADLLYTTDKISGGLSWQVAFHGLNQGTQLLIGNALLGLFLLAVVALSTVEDLAAYIAVVTLLFLVLSKYVIEQYLTWPIAFLAVLCVNRRSRPALLMLVVLTGVGMLVNPYIHPFGEQPGILNGLLAAVIIVFVVRLIRDQSRHPEGQPRD